MSSNPLTRPDVPVEEMRISEQFTLGWDPAKQRDYSAIAVLERVRFVSNVVEQRGFEPPALLEKSREEYWVRHLQRLKRGTNYVDQVEIVGALFRALPVTKEPPTLCLDVTGAGRPLEDVARRRGLQPHAILITGGHAETRVGRFELHVPRKVLLTNLAVQLQNGTLKVAPGLAEGETLVTELANVRLRAFSAEAENDTVTDDLAFAVALGLLLQMRRPKPWQVIKGGVVTFRGGI